MLLEGTGGQRTMEAAKWEVDVEYGEGTKRLDGVGSQRLFLKLTL